MAVSVMPWITIGGVTLPSLTVILPMSITIGREDPSSQPDANSLTFGYWAESMPAHIYRGAPVSVWLSSSIEPDGWNDIWTDIWEGYGADGAGQKKFVGRVADISAQPDVSNGMIRASILCIGTLTDLGDQIIGDSVWPIETDLERINRVAALIRPSQIPSFVNDGSPALRLRRRDADRVKVLEVLHQFAASIGSILWEYPDGSVKYQRYDARRVAADGAYLTLPPQAIIDDPQWSQSSDQLIDRVRVEYGPDPNNGVRNEFIAGLGDHETIMSGEVADLATAGAVANTVLARWGRTDLWDVTAINTRSDLLDQDTYDALLAALPSDPLVTGNLTPYPTPADQAGGAWFIEGWTETWDRPGAGNAPLVHEYAISVSDIRRFAVGGAAVDDLVCTVDPLSYGMSQSGEVVVTVSRASGAVLPNLGIYTVTVDGETPLYPWHPGGVGAVTSFIWRLKQNQIQPGKHQIQVAYSGYPDQYRPAVSNVETLTVIDTGFSQITISAPTSTPHVDESQTIIAHLFDDLNGTPEGKVSFQFSDNSINGPWTEYEVVDASGGTDGAEVTTSYTVGPGTRWWRGVYTPEADETRWAASISNILGIKGYQRVSKTIEYSPAWTQTYAETGAQIPVADLSQGDWGDAYGDRRGLAGFAVDPAEWVNHFITKVEVYLFATEFQNGQGGTIRVGSHQYATKPVSNANQYLHRSDVSQWPQMTGRWVDCTAWGRALVSGQSKGIIIGPADRDGSPVMQGSVNEAGIILRVSGYRWHTGGTGSWDNLGTTAWDSMPPTLTWDQWTMS